MPFLYTLVHKVSKNAHSLSGTQALFCFPCTKLWVMSSGAFPLFPFVWPASWTSFMRSVRGVLHLQGGLWKNQSRWSGPSRSGVAAQMRCQSEVSRFWSLAARLQRAANWGSGQIQDPGDRRHRVLHHVPRVWPPGWVSVCGRFSSSRLHFPPFGHRFKETFPNLAPQVNLIATLSDLDSSPFCATSFINILTWHHK